ncbi:phage tail protein [Romboutsia sp. 1001713B170207_170306_H8]|uniref:phage tail protein n=1 Tax=Romboutsia sp. 1001713B170207_170306_H8 TaxID=2787112 RepID=UPI00189A502F|nr:phage tail protein [Romboutsia sp. 1001713B170207_170306_H8]
MADGQIIIDTQVDSSGAEKDVKGLSGKLGSFTKTAAKTTAAMVTVATGAIAALAKLSVEQYAEYEQLTGGVETLFKKSSNKVMEYANNAYKTAGMSANEYMNTITGFAASLLQGLGGDTKKAAEIGNMAVTDMSDNANKMGTAIENIQNAYQGFAKQNYTMLDNLKLGYGGTKTEMQRLLADAQKISGVKYDIKNFNDVIEAIHVIQKNMGITGTTSLEAATTIEGSLNMTKAAWTNLLTGMADDQANFDTLINNLVDSASAFGDNILPRIEIAIKGIGQLVEQLLPPIVARLPKLITDILPSLLNAGVQMVGSLGNGIIQALPTLINCGVQAIETILNGITSNLPQIVSGAMVIIQSLVDGLVQVAPLLLDAGLQLIIALGQGIADNLPTLMPKIIDCVIKICDTFIENLPLLIDVAVQIILALVQGLVTALPTLIAEVPRIINSFADAIYNALPQILLAGIEILMMLIKGLITSIPTLVANIPQIIMAIVNAVTLYNWAGLGKNVINWLSKGISSMTGSIGSTAKGVAEWVGKSITNVFKGGLSWGKNLISSIGQGFSSMISFLGSSARSVATNALTAIKTKFSEGFNIGKNLIQGIWNGISNMKQWILNKIGGFAGSIINGIKGFFDIHSPSRVMRDLIGVNLVRGIGVGIDVETPNLEKDIDANMSDLVAKMQSTVNYETSRTSARVSAHNNVLGDGDEGDTSSSKEKPIVVEAKFIVDGKEFTQTVVAPNQDVLTEYYEGR